MHSTVTAAVQDGTALTAQYWVRNLREPVRFFETLRALLADGCDAFIEMSPHPILLSAVEDVITDAGVDAVALPSMRRDEHERDVLLTSLGALYARGAAVRWNALWPHRGAVVALPDYPWQRQRYWLSRTIPATRGAPTAGGHASAHPLLGARLQLADPRSNAWESRLDLRRVPFAGDHRLHGAPVLAASALVEMMLAAGGQLLESGSVELSAVEFEQALYLDEGPAGTELQVHATARTGRSTAASAEYEIAIFSRNARGWSRHASAVARANAAAPICHVARPMTGDIQHADSATAYDALERAGALFGPRLRQLSAVDVSTDARAAVASLATVDGGPGASACTVEPATLDACFQIAVLSRSGVSTSAGLAMPSRIDRVRQWPGERRNARLIAHASAPNAAATDVLVAASDGATALELIGLQLRAVDDSTAGIHTGDPSTWLYEAAWEAKPLKLAPGATRAVGCCLPPVVARARRSPPS